MGTLYITATPIGNLKDITLRALEVLRSVDVILCEDTRVTKKLLTHFDIHKPTISYHSYSTLSKVERIIELLRENKSLALVSDAGTPGISDPGNELVSKVRNTLPDVSVVVIPGPSALTAALSGSGFPASEFHFLGYPPHKKGREKFFTKITELKETVVFFESKHRLMKALGFLAESFGNDRSIVVASELTKFFEEFTAGSAEEVYRYFERHKDKIKGEFVIMVSPKKR